MDINIEKLEQIKKSEQVLDMYVDEVDDLYTMIGHIGNNIKAILPREEASSVVEEDGLVNTKHIVNKKGKRVQVCIKDIIQESEEVTIVTSKKLVELKVRRWMYGNLKPGVKLKGFVRGMTDFAAFVDVGGGVTGIVKISEITDVPIQSVSDVLKIGQRLNVTVVSFDRDTGKIELSCKESFGTFEQNAKGFKEGDIVEAIVRKRIKTGIFVELKPNLVGISDHVNGMEYGQTVLVSIKKINYEKKKIKVVIIG